MAQRRMKNRAKLVGSGIPTLQEIGNVYETNLLRLAANVADEETVTIGTDVFEFDRAANGVVAGRIAVTAHAADTPTAASTALVAKINAAGTQRVTAVRISANEILLVSQVKAARALACTETLAGENNAFAAAAMYGGSQAGPRKRALVSRVPNATEVALGSMYFDFDFAPAVTRMRINVFVTATPGLAKAWDGGASVASNRLTITNAGDTDWAATDTVVVEVWEA